MYLWCRGCGGRFLLAKYYPTGGWFTYSVGTKFVKTDGNYVHLDGNEFRDFLDDHGDCYYTTNDGEHAFGFGYELSMDRDHLVDESVRPHDWVAPDARKEEG